MQQTLQGTRLRHGLDPIEMRRPAGPLSGPSPSRHDLGIDGHLMKHGEQGDGGEFFEQVIGNLSGHALTGLRVQGRGELGVFPLQERALKEMVGCATGVDHTNHLFGGAQAHEIGPDAAGCVLGAIPAREENRVNVLYGGIDAYGLPIRCYSLRQWGDLRFGELGKRPDLDGQGARRIAGFLQQFLRPRCPFRKSCTSRL